MRQEHVEVAQRPKKEPRVVYTIEIAVPERSVRAHGGEEKMGRALDSAIRAMGLKVSVISYDKER